MQVILEYTDKGLIGKKIIKDFIDIKGIKGNFEYYLKTLKKVSKKCPGAVLTIKLNTILIFITYRNKKDIIEDKLELTVLHTSSNKEKQYLNTTKCLTAIKQTIKNYT